MVKESTKNDFYRTALHAQAFDGKTASSLQGLKFLQASSLTPS